MLRKDVNEAFSIFSILLGSYGVVYKGIEKSTGNLVAMKKIRLRHQSEGIPGTALREMTLLRRLKHPNIISCVFFFFVSIYRLLNI